MHLEGQATRSSVAVNQRGLPAAAAAAEAGFALAALLVAIAILSVMMLVVLPTWRHQAQREKEAELVFRGEQYARAIGLYQRKLAGSFPPSLDLLIEQKFLRKKYKDPITGEDFVPIYANSTAGMAAMQQGGPPAPATPPPPGPGRTGGSAPAPGGRGPGSITFQSPSGDANRRIIEVQAARTGVGGQTQLSGAAGGIVGVTSKSKAQSIRLYNGRDRYDQWIFTYMAASPQAGQSIGPGQQPPTQQSPGLPQRGTGPGRGRGGGVQ